MEGNAKVGRKVKEKIFFLQHLSWPWLFLSFIVIISWDDRERERQIQVASDTASSDDERRHLDSKKKKEPGRYALTFDISEREIKKVGR